MVYDDINGFCSVLNQWHFPRKVSLPNVIRNEDIPVLQQNNQTKVFVSVCRVWILSVRFVTTLSSWWPDSNPTSEASTPACSLPSPTKVSLPNLIHHEDIAVLQQNSQMKVCVSVCRVSESFLSVRFLTTLLSWWPYSNPTSEASTPVCHPPSRSSVSKFGDTTTGQWLMSTVVLWGDERTSTWLLEKFETEVKRCVTL